MKRDDSSPCPPFPPVMTSLIANYFEEETHLNVSVSEIYIRHEEMCTPVLSWQHTLKMQFQLKKKKMNLRNDRRKFEISIWCFWFIEETTAKSTTANYGDEKLKICCKLHMRATIHKIKHPIATHKMYVYVTHYKVCWNMESKRSTRYIEIPHLSHVTVMPVAGCGLHFKNVNMQHLSPPFVGETV